MPENIDKTFKVFNPATGDEVAEYPLMDKDEVDRLVDRAKTIFPKWAVSSFDQRRKILSKSAAILAENALHYASIISSENGKTRLDALLADIFPSCDLMKYYADNAEKFLEPVHVHANPLLPGRRCYYTFEPKGVVGIVAPWNYPFSLCVGPVVSAIASGNTVVLKPSSQTTASGLILKEILDKAGLPKDVLQVATGSGAMTGELLIDHPGLDMIFFTGSTAVGREVNIKAARRLIPTIMELGGKDSAIVTKHADIERAAHAIVWGSFTNSGQTCIGIEICLVERSVYKEFVEMALEIVGSLKSGDGPGEVGSMTMAAQLKIVEDQVADAAAKGAKILTGGARDPKPRGMYYQPTLITDVTPDMKLMTEETFGPLLPIVPFDSIDEALNIANGTPYGLSGAVFTEDMKEGREIAARIKTGSVNINDTLVTFAIPSLPFGGAKQSGVGRYHGEIGIRAFTNTKSITEFDKGWKKEFYHYPMVKGIEPALINTLKIVYSENIFRRFISMIKVIPFLFRALRESGAIGRLRKD